MIQTIHEFYRDARPYTELVNRFVEKTGLVGAAQADHICYKCGSKESFESQRALLEPESEYVYQSYISGRRIACIRLKRPIETSLGTIHLLELSDQKRDGSQRDGFDHIEAYARRGSYEEMVAKLKKTEKVVAVVRPHHSTHDIDIGNGFLFRCTRGPLVEKIKREEMSR